MEKLVLGVEDQSWEVYVGGVPVDAFNSFRDAVYHHMIYYTDREDVEIYRIVVLKEKVH